MSVIFKTVKICPHCRRPLIPSNVPDYVWQCMDCDEDIYDVECRFEKCAVIRRGNLEIVLSYSEMGDIGRHVAFEDLKNDVFNHLSEDIDNNDFIRDPTAIEAIARMSEKRLDNEPYWNNISDCAALYIEERRKADGNK